MKKAIGLALAVLITSVVAAGGARCSEGRGGARPPQLQEHDHAPPRHPGDRRCRFLGAEQGAGRSTPSRRLRPSSGSRSSSCSATPRSRAAAPALTFAQKYRRQERACRFRPSTSGASRASSTDILSGRHPDLPVCDAHRPDDRPAASLIGRPLLPGRPGRLHPGSADAKFMINALQGEEGRPARLPGAVFGRPG